VLHTAGNLIPSVLTLSPRARLKAGCLHKANGNPPCFAFGPFAKGIFIVQKRQLSSAAGFDRKTKGCARFDDLLQRLLTGPFKIAPRVDCSFNGSLMTFFGFLDKFILTKIVDETNQLQEAVFKRIIPYLINNKKYFCYLIQGEQHDIRTS
jgi:hypothetical protein